MIKQTSTPRRHQACRVGHLVRPIVLTASLIAAAAAANAEPLAGSFVLNNVTILDGAGGTHKASALWVKAGKIHSIQPSTKAAPPWAKSVVDGHKGFVTPGFIELSTQLGLFEVAGEPTANDAAYAGNTETPALDAADAFNANNTHIALARDGGVTMVLSGPQGGLISGRAVRVALDSAGLATPVPNAAMMADLRVRDHYGRTRAGVFMRLHEIADAVAAYKKAPDRDDSYRKGRHALSPRQLQALAPVFAGKMPLIVQVDRESDIRSLLRFVDARRELRQTLNVVISSGVEAWRVAEELSRRKIPVILTPSAQDPSTFDRLRARDDGAAILLEAGVPVVISSATWANNVRRLRHEAGLAVANGLTAEQALTAITKTPAKVLGVDRVQGQLLPGMRADLTLFDGDPLDVTSRPRLLVIDGNEVPLRSRQRALAKKYR